MVMALNYRSVDRDLPFLVPPDMRDWLPENHLAWFILDVVRELDTSALHAKSKRGGTGREGFNPELLLAVWVYASARGISSSRQIERACTEDVAFRVLCAQDVPDHTVLARFRQHHQDAMADLFAQVLTLCVGQGLGRFGVIAIDGTKIKANASKSKSLSLKRLRVLAAAELDKAEATDRAEDLALVPAAGDDLPPGFGPGADRGSRIRAAIKDLDSVILAENKPTIDKLAGQLVVAEERLKKHEARYLASRRRYDDDLANKRLPGRAPSPDNVATCRSRRGVLQARARVARAQKRSSDQAAGQTDRTRRTLLARNTTDLASRVMHTRSGYVQGYNNQVAVADDLLILAIEATDDPNDVQQLIPMMVKVKAAIEHLKAVTDRTDLDVGMVVVDNGYLSEENVTAPGYDRLIAPGRGTMKDGQWVGKVKGAEGQKTSLAAGHMLAKLKEPGNQELYKRRGATVEPVNGHLKDRRGLRQFSRRGLDAVNAELHMAALTTNLMKLFTTTWQPARATT